MTRPTRTRAEIKALGKELRHIHIGTESDELFRNYLDRLLEEDEDGNLLPQAIRWSDNAETRSIMVVGGSGAGKSSLVRRNLREHPALSAAAGAPQDHYLYVEFPSPATFKSLGLEVLRASGYPEVSERREAWSIWNLVRHRLSSLGITVLCIDEAHDLFCADRNLILRGLKSLMQGDNALILIICGTDELPNLIRSDPQVQRRFSTLTLPPVFPATHGDNVAMVIEHYCRKAGLDAPVEPDLIPRLMHASRHRFGRTLETATLAVEAALALEGTTRLTMQHFAEVWAREEGCDPDRNVFLSPNWGNLQPDAKPSDTQLGKASKSEKRRKK